MSSAARGRPTGMDEAAAIIAATDYMTLATADADGVPWATPVWFAPEGERAVLWLSRPEARHSRNLRAQPRLAIAIFDSRVQSEDAAAVYFDAVAEQVDDGIGTFSAYSLEHGRGEWTHADITAPSPLRLYRAEITDRWLLSAGARDRVRF
ncbi:pyridoxamine 5'-phosphate oxidase family protein [Solirubrobacter taibaiensis]|nr:pyridoxamine 5'-phosphate oxidase family protein [Solirubrobacter taibaiensis]